MNLAKFNFSEFDLNFSATKKNGVYLINSNNDFINYYLSLQIAFENVLKKKRVLFFTDNDFCTLKDYGVNINLDFNRIFNSDYFLLLQYPKNLYDLFRDPGVVTSFLRDIDNYIEEFNPAVVLFDRVNKFYLSDDVKIGSFKNRFLASIKKNYSINYLLGSVGEFFEYKKIENLVEGIFKINYSYDDKGKNFITYCLSSKKEVKLKIDLSPNGIVVDPKGINFKKLSLKKITIIMYPSFLNNFEKDIKNIFGNQVLCKSFVNEKDLQVDNYKDTQLAIFLPDWIGFPSVFEYARKLKKEFPKITLFLLTSKLTAYSHKARAKRIGFNDFLEMPAGINEIKKLFRKKISNNNPIEDIDGYNVIFDKNNIMENDNYSRDELSEILTRFSKKKIFAEESFALFSIISRVKFDEKEIERNINFPGLELIIGKNIDSEYHYVLIVNSKTEDISKIYKNSILKKFNKNLDIDDNFTNFENNVITDYTPKKIEEKIISFESYFYPLQNPNFNLILEKVLL